MASTEEAIKVDPGNPAEHVEGKHVDGDLLLKSGYDELGLWATVKRFKKVMKF